MAYLSEETLEGLVIEYALQTAWRRDALAAVAELALPDGWLGAGFVRTPVWDRLHGFREATPLNDLDVVYFDPSDRDPARDRALEARLRFLVPRLPWQVRNQARMHRRNGDRPYTSTADALCHWLETPTAVALRLEHGRPALLAPLGLEDLMGLRLRPTPHARRHRLADYRARVVAKDWCVRWPKIAIDWGWS